MVFSDVFRGLERHRLIVLIDFYMIFIWLVLNMLTISHAKIYLLKDNNRNTRKR